MSDEKDAEISLAESLSEKKSHVLKLWVIFVSSFLLFGISIILGIALYVVSAISPMSNISQDIVIEVPLGASTNMIARTLQENQIIRDERIFIYYLKLNRQGKQFKAGQYLMTTDMKYTEIIEKLNQGDVIPLKTRRMTFREGLTVEEIAYSMAQQSDLSAEIFLASLQNPEQFSFSILESIPNYANLRYTLEGYLFPDTYDFSLDITEKDVISRMIQEMSNKLKQLPDNWTNQLDSLGITLHELLTIASMIEREARVVEERSIVASVIYNRLAINMPLQIDATVQYALGENKERIFEQDLKTDHPYNTYVYPDLPPGPIAAPGLASIEAALYPSQTDYFYYVTKKDGSNTHYFSKTYQEHLRNIALSKKNVP